MWLGRNPPILILYTPNGKKNILSFKVTAYNKLANHRLGPGNIWARQHGAGKACNCWCQNIQKHVQFTTKPGIAQGWGTHEKKTLTPPPPKKKPLERKKCVREEKTN